MSRRSIPAATCRLILLEGGYKCANPACRHVLTLELHHIEWVRDGGGKAAESRADQLDTAWVLPAPRDASKPCSRHILRDWWNKAEELAGLEPIEGLGWHGLRRKFATEMQDAPPAVLCSLGGWKDFATIQKCYQQPDEEAMQEALQGRRSVA